MSTNTNNKLRIAFIVGAFPIISETFIINQVAYLLDRGIDVEIFTFETGANQFISSRYKTYRMSDLTHNLQPPASKFYRLLAAVPIALRLLCSRPSSLIRALNIVKYGKQAWSLKFLYWIIPFVGKQFDLVHCHFGNVATRFLTIKELLGLDVPIVTTFYGFDVSILFKQCSPNFYDRLKRECDLFFVMSNNMKQRVLAHGFPEEKVKVLPVSIDVGSYPFRERIYDPIKPVELVSVGRFVEKKGFDDLLRALAIVKQRTDRAFHCSIIGGGELEKRLRDLTSSLGLDDVVDFKGYMKIEDIIQLLLEYHIMVQPSKTASNGDME
jgi:colanic acid/amylovoran biosynthesis glycosyltransferase